MSDKRTKGTVGLLDIGTSKVAAAVLTRDGKPGEGTGLAGGAKIAGLGVQRSRGVKAGVLTDLDEAEQAVRAAISQAERAAGRTIEQVIVSVSCGRIKSQHFSAGAEIDSGIVAVEDIDKLEAGARAYAERDGRLLVHMNQLDVRLDGAQGAEEPVGLAARHIGAGFHAVTADEAPVRNLLLLIERCYLECDGLVATPYASSLAVTSEEERQIGVTCVDLGAGTASIAIFAEGRFVGADVVPVGSQHITFDIARALQTPLSEAERIKTLYGRLAAAQSDEHEAISYPLAGEEEGATYQTTKARLGEVIRPRAAQILSLVRERLALNPASALAGNNVVFTGGASQLLGAAEFAANELGCPVRIGRPQHVPGLPAAIAGPQFAALAGLALSAGKDQGSLSQARERAAFGESYLNRVGTWLKSGF